MTKRGKKRTIQVAVWTDDDEALAHYVNGVRLMADAAFGSENESVTFSDPGVKKLRRSLDGVTWHSANVAGRMRMK